MSTKPLTAPYRLIWSSEIERWICDWYHFYITKTDDSYGYGVFAKVDIPLRLNEIEITKGSG